ncbi:MAG: Methyltransferase domain [Phormidium sp. OSCR]|nr:MAG: Methyltransferase domain [Phormidium sp. OSCR]
MTDDAIARRQQEIIQQHGPWTNHNLRLGDHLYTMSDETCSGAEVKVRRVLQAVRDFCGEDLSRLRVLDLACLEGLYGLELALHGATVVGLEGRESNLAKARFSQEVLHLDKIEFVCDDVRNLSRERYGSFDVVLCIGIFYHLNAPDVFEFAQHIADVSSRLALFDTHVSSTAEQAYEYRGQTYWGRSYAEDHMAWGSIGNEESAWLTRPSLYNLLADVGFDSVYECHQPMVPKYEQMRQAGQADRSTFLALHNPPHPLKTTDLLRNQPRDRYGDGSQSAL